MQAINYQAKGVNYPSLEVTGSWCSSGLRALFPIERTIPGSVEKGELVEKRRSRMKIKLGNDVCHYPHFAFFLNVHYEATPENVRIVIGTCEIGNNHL